MTPVASLVLVVELLALALGVLLVRAAYRAYQRTESRALRSVAIGFGFLTLSGALAGGLHRLLSIGLETSVLVDRAMVAVGFAVLAHALYVVERRPEGGEGSAG